MPRRPALKPRKDGRYALSLQRDKQRVWVYGKTPAETRAKLEELKDQLRRGERNATADQPLRDYLIEWLDSIKTDVRPSTYRVYSVHLRLHLGDLAAITLRKLTPADIAKHERALQGAGYAPATVANFHGMLTNALGRAERWQLLSRNVARLVSPPRPQETERPTLTAQQARTLLQAARGHPYEAAWVLGLLGLRLGEVLGLRWEAVDLDAGVLEVRGTLGRTLAGELSLGPPKTRRSRRPVKITRLAVAALQRRRETQTADRLLVSRWQDSGYVFTRLDGRPVAGSSFTTSQHYPLLKAAGLPRVRFHDLRHTAATLAVDQGLSLQVVSQLLGHSSAKMSERYAHVTAAMQAQVAALFDGLLEGES